VVEAKTDIDDKIRRAYAEAFGTESGQLVLRDLALRFHLFESTMKRGAEPNDLAMAAGEGERNVVLFILRQLAASRMPKTRDDARPAMTPEELLDMWMRLAHERMHFAAE
jgi:hypothetical protein